MILFNSKTPDYEWLSNMSLHAVYGYPTVENAYQACKLLDKAAREPFRHCSPYEAKRLGKRVPLRDDWESIKDNVMFCLLRKKFTSHPALAEQLLKTGEEDLIHYCPWGDAYWGVTSLTHMEGQNRLGKMLMLIRSDLKWEHTQ